MNFKKTIQRSGLLAALVFSGGVSAGPVIIGGDDLTDHGSFSGGANQTGWLYIEKAIANLDAAQTRPGTYTHDIAALGSAPSTATSGNAGAAIGSAASALGMTVDYRDGAAAITSFFSDLASGAVNPKILWIAGTGASNDLVSSEGAALTAAATAIDTFVGSGGGLLAHGSGSTAFGWLGTLLPGLSFPSGCTSSGATLTAAGTTAFPGLTNADISSGPCHNHFTGALGGLTVLAYDGATTPRAFIIGSSGAGGGSITQPGPSLPEPTTLALFGLGLVGLAMRRKA